ncbi:hypothetical protein CYMTET_24750 [Cymbomonas tetramitiformis]|uniref:Reticulon-like protein n=1 Tax=Cymbomonas tetramitiformis TaxID=36881 RepID=A0AAE0FVR9_9CHLO|nr:hypothetical protein CYMTET_24750 [Cymbomonas tetramitiformis]
MPADENTSPCGLGYQETDVNRKACLHQEISRGELSRSPLGVVDTNANIADKLTNSPVPSCLDPSLDQRPSESKAYCDIYADLILWRVPSRTGTVFAGLLYLLGTARCTPENVNPLSLFCNGLLCHLVWRYLKSSFTPTPSPYTGYHITEDEGRQMGLWIAEKLNLFLGVHRYFFSGEDVELTIKVACGLFAFAKLGNYISAWMILTSSIICLFTVPFGYITNKPQIDALVLHYKAEVIGRWTGLPLKQQRLITAAGAALLLAMTDVLTRLFLFFLVVAMFQLKRADQAKMQFAVEAVKKTAKAAKKRLSIGATDLAASLRNSTPRKAR